MQKYTRKASVMTSTLQLYIASIVLYNDRTNVLFIMQTIDQALAKLNKSKFRSKFHLSAADRAYIEEKGMDTIRRHAEGFVLCRLSPAVIENDGKQTPTSGHPVFKAQHACACCCRECLSKWYGVPKGVQLTEDQQRRIVNLLMIWIERELAGN